jgi:hypothetical protein
LDLQLALHFSVTQAAELGALKEKRSGLIGREFHRHSLAFRQFLIDVEAVNFEPMIPVYRRDYQFDSIPLLHRDGIGLEIVLFRRNLDLYRWRRALRVSADSNRHDGHRNGSDYSRIAA